MEEGNVKKWYQSKTVWANVVTFGIAALALIGQLSFLPEHAVEIILLVSAVLNVALRTWFTKTTLK